MQFFQTTILSIIVATAGIAFSAPAFAESMVEQTQAGSFIKKSKSIKGDWQIIERDGQNIIQFSDNFKAKRGPDLKVFLSPQTVRGASGKTALAGAVRLGELKSNKGAQEYVIPAGVDLSSFNSVLVHCEAYSVLWGGADI